MGLLELSVWPQGEEAWRSLFINAICRAPEQQQENTDWGSIITISQKAMTGHSNKEPKREPSQTVPNGQFELET